MKVLPHDNTLVDCEWDDCDERGFDIRVTFAEGGWAEMQACPDHVKEFLSWGCHA